jgi:hypothetical protein
VLLLLLLLLPIPLKANKIFTQTQTRDIRPHRQTAVAESQQSKEKTKQVIRTGKRKYHRCTERRQFIDFILRGFSKAPEREREITNKKRRRKRIID